MSQVVINSYSEFEKYVGKDLGTSGYLKVTQEMINKFADATLDHQWIHLDKKRAKAESPFGTTIAHGYLTVSLAPHLWQEIVDIRNLKMMINYGIENLRFNKPVLEGDEVRLKAHLLSIADLRGITKAQLKITLEIKDNPKPAYTANLVFLYHFQE